MVPLVAYCKKCKKEVPIADICVSCGKKLPKTSKRLSWYYENMPIKDWLTWNGIMRIVIPMFLLMLIIILPIELVNAGDKLERQFLLYRIFYKLLAFGALTIVVLAVILLAQGRELIQTIVDNQGIHSYIYLIKPSRLKWLLRLQMPKKDENGYKLDKCVYEKHLLWKDIKGIYFWKDKWKIIFNHPKYWAALPIHCTPINYDHVAEYVLNKLKRRKDVLIKSADRGLRKGKS